jgi:hypothetical protein
MTVAILATSTLGKVATENRFPLLSNCSSNIGRNGELPKGQLVKNTEQSILVILYFS